MSGRNFTDVMAYWGGKEKTAPKIPRAFGKKAPPQQQQQPQIQPQQPPQVAISQPAVVNVVNITINNVVSQPTTTTPIKENPYIAGENNGTNVSPDTEQQQSIGSVNPYANADLSSSTSSQPVVNKYDNQNFDPNQHQQTVNSYNSSNYGGSSGVPSSTSASQYGASQYGASQYGASQYGSESDRRAYLMDEDDDYYDDDGEYGDDDEVKKSYNERDISELDLSKLEGLLLGTSITASESSEYDIQQSIDDLKRQQEEAQLKTQDIPEMQPSFNPYISNGPSIITSSSYKDAKFLLDGKSSSSPQKDSTVESLTSWNSEFQKLIEMDDCLEKFERLSSLEHDFVYAAETYGRIIISEHFLPHNVRTIKPVTVGGIAGGEKYIVQGILFKFAVENETFGLYGNDENAMKTAAHELNGCTSFLNVGVKGLHVPLMAYIDYRGFRLVAMSLLPISKKSLVYGSSDAGQTVHTSNTLFNHLFASSAKIVNLKSHLVQDSSGDFKSLHGPIDIEGHIGSDNRFYLLDFARLSPPEPPSHRGSYLYKLLRLEFVRSYEKPLCSDAFSPMVSIDIENHNTEVREAYEHLLKVLVPKVAKIIDEKQQGSSINSDLKQFSKLLHSEGINVRLIGNIYNELTTFNSKIFVVVEATIRTLKSLARELLRREMKKTHLPSDFPYKTKMLNFLNLIFGELKGATLDFWDTIFVEKLKKKYKGMEKDNTLPLENLSLLYKVEKPLQVYTTVGEIIKHFILQSDYLRNYLFEGFIKCIGLNVSEAVQKEFCYNSSTGFLFVDPDIKELTTIITRLNIIDYADGMSLYYKSMLLKENNKAKQRLLSISKSRLEQSLSSMSTNYLAIFQLGNVIRLMAKFNTEHYPRLDALELAENTYLSVEKLRVEGNLLFLAKTNRAKTLYLKLIDSPRDVKSLGNLQDIAKDFKSNYSTYKGFLYPSYLLAKIYYVRCLRSYEENYMQIYQNFQELIEKDPQDYKSHMVLGKFLIHSEKYLKEIPNTQELIRNHLSTAIKGDPTLVRKLSDLVHDNPWAVYPFASSSPSISNEIRQHFGKVTGSMIVPSNQVINSSDSEYFTDVNVDKLSIKEGKHANSVVNLISFLGQKLQRLNISKIEDLSSVTIIPAAIESIKNTLVSINLGGCAFVTDEIFTAICSPLLKKIKIFRNNNITSVSYEAMVNVAGESLETLDVGQCENLTDDTIKGFTIKCPKLKKLALPSSVSTQTVKELLDNLKELHTLDTLGCNTLDREVIKLAFEWSTSLIKLRDSVGVPHFTFIKGNQLSIKNINPHFTMAQETIYLATFQSFEKFMMLVVGFKKLPFVMRSYTVYLHKDHKLVKFRDSPLEVNNSGYLKVSYIERVEKPMAQAVIYNPIRKDSYNIHLQTIKFPPVSVGAAIINFTHDHCNYLINTRSQGMATSTFNSTLSENGVTRTSITNQRNNKISIDVDTMTTTRFQQFAVHLSMCHEP
ncbi:hypothetical protein DLAC_05501 [Tieghemostelium lacteum]|uniref:Clu domain-containing protein n=1 Tax=Tieghemostelium lacteum TaxID=361077 RepID=A0A151ZG68_TIELA|nr:hypothetical protein DLAC_05501 [Tieghemostelium lacteum]|eukprot:KYQ92909.1 hypothetical protein DLAC_05501 [Tieghemostelium lacteum]